MAKEYTPRQSNKDAYAALTDIGGTLPPQAPELEEAVLGALMLESHSIERVEEFLVADAFYVDTHKTIFNAIQELNNDRQPVDLLTVTERLKKQKKLKEVGGATFLAQLTQKVASAMNVEFHATIIAQKYVQRELIKASTEIQRRSYDESTDVTELIDYAEAEIFKVSEGHVKRDVKHSKHVLAKAMKAIEEASMKGGMMNGVPSGFTKLDALTLGWQPSDLIIIAARPSMGKTAFVLSMARNMTIDYNMPVAFFSLEMSDMQLMMRLIVSESGLTSQDVRSGRLTEEQWKHLEESTRPLAVAPLFIDDTPALSITEFRSKARRLKTQHDIKLIVIDYLQLMSAGSKDKSGNREQEVSTISRTLKAIAKELDIPIIALSQLNRSVETRGGTRRPQLSDLRESGAIEQDADIVSFIHRPEYYQMFEDEDGNSTKGMAEIIIAKHRNGATDTIKLRFRNNQARFVNYDDNDLQINSSMNDDDGGFGGYGINDFETTASHNSSFGKPLSTNDKDEVPF